MFQGLGALLAKNCFLVLKFVPLPLLLSLGTTGKSLALSSLKPLQVFSHISEILPEPPPLQAQQDQLYHIDTI